MLSFKENTGISNRELKVISVTTNDVKKSVAASQIEN